ncbi:hypothetical protein [Ovoidimarina sediminis]|uniref:hypothetical protein n=1 Tax=Ovoidimarina sediminis TaxID=3079856 RepID=UPI002906EE05|nr:hypothetical protein [Rhodophyticola sp. MJ-SS7]MDU8943329.1 hypothetical protein [Rhodophyticola sp. MJ-SS7]
MEEAALSRFCQDLADAVIEGRLDDALRVYSYPLAVYRPGGVNVERSREDTQRALTGRMSVAKSNGTVAIATKLLNIDRSKQGRIILEVEWAYLGPACKELDRTHLRYYCRTDGSGALRIEMVDLERMAFHGAPGLWQLPDRPH